jgi:hypothetical protein
MRLGVRAERVAGEIAHEEGTLQRARRTVADRENAQRRTGETYTRKQREERARLLDAQAALPAAGRARRSSAGMDHERRDYAALAGLAGYGRRDYERLDPQRRRQARAQIDRELALRKELSGAAADLAPAAGESSLGPREQRKAGRQFDRALAERPRADGHSSPKFDTSRHEEAPAVPSKRTQRRGSSVLDDAREVAARRKRQLGRDRR